MTHPYARVAPDLSVAEDVRVMFGADRRRSHPETWAFDSADEAEAILCRDCGTITDVDDAVDELPCPGTITSPDERHEVRCGSLDTMRVIVIDDPEAPRWSPWRQAVVRPLDEAIRR